MSLLTSFLLTFSFLLGLYSLPWKKMLRWVNLADRSCGLVFTKHPGTTASVLEDNPYHLESPPDPKHRGAFASGLGMGPIQRIRADNRACHTKAISPLNQFLSEWCLSSEGLNIVKILFNRVVLVKFKI